MGTFAAGQVVVLPFPFSDLSRKKLRPALLLADAGRGDWIACQITSNPYADNRAITLAESEFVEGGLQRVLSAPRQIIHLPRIASGQHRRRAQQSRVTTGSRSGHSDDSGRLGLRI